MKEKTSFSRTAKVFMIAFLAVGVAACGKSNNDSASGDVYSAGSSPAANAQTVRVDAANFEWKLDMTEFKAGQPVSFEVHGINGAHGFSIVGSDVSEPVKEGDSITVNWTPDKPGEYKIKCNSMCGSGHSSMETTITVK